MRHISSVLAIREGLVDLTTQARVDPVLDEIESVLDFVRACCPLDEYCPRCRDLFVVIAMLRDEARDLERLDPIWTRLMAEDSVQGISRLLAYATAPWPQPGPATGRSAPFRGTVPRGSIILTRGPGRGRLHN